MGGTLTLCIIGAVVLTALIKKADIYSALTSGAKKGLSVCVGILPVSVIMYAAVSMFRASGIPEMITDIISPISDVLGFPEECLTLALLRPLSWGASLSAAGEIMQTCGADSFAGRTAAVILAAGEAGFYVTALYASSVGLKKTAYVIPSILTGYMAAYLIAPLTVRLFM